MGFLLARAKWSRATLESASDKREAARERWAEVGRKGREEREEWR